MVSVSNNWHSQGKLLNFFSKQKESQLQKMQFSSELKIKILQNY
jgi:hypothetical protein